MGFFSLEKDEFLQVYNYAKQFIEYRKKYFENYKLRFVLTKYGGKNRVFKWIDEDEFLDFDKTFSLIEDNNIISISMTALPNELVLESDSEEFNESVNKLLLEELKAMNLKFWVIYSGGKSLHFHILFKRDYLSILEKVKEELINYLKIRVPGLDISGKSYNHPWRLPFTYHPETGKKAELVINIEKNLENMENDVPGFILEKIKNNKKEIKINKVVNVANVKGSGIRSKLYDLYNELIRIQIEDGRDRLMMIIVTLAKYLNIDSTKFAEDLENWAKLNDWKEYKYRNWIKYYQEDRYKWMKNYRWAIREFLEASDISEEDKNKVIRIIAKYLPFMLNKGK